MSVIVKVTRRDFLRRTGVGAGAFVLGCYINPAGTLEARNLVREARNILKHGLPLNAFVSMHLNGVVEIMAPRSEMGQGIRYSLAAVLADELEADWTKIKVIQSDADGTRFSIGNPNVNINPNASPAYLINDELSQFADSSRSMALFYMPMRLFGAGIRLVMIKAAAKKWGVDPSECYAKLHHVHEKGGTRSEPYNHLLLEAAMVGLPQMPEILDALKPEKDWTYIGTKNMPFNDAKDMVTGKAVYGADVDFPGMLTAMVVRCPVANGGIKSYDDSETRKVPGVVNVVKIDLGNAMLRGGVGAGFMPHCGVAVVAKNTWAALQGRRALKVEWDLSGLAEINATYDSDTYRRRLEQATASGENAEVLRNKGDVYAALSAAGPDTVKADYYVPHLAQAPMEPPVTTARYQNGRWELWTSSQGPELLQHYVGLAMLYPADPVKWLAWQATEPRDVRPTEVEDQKLFNKEYAALPGVGDEHRMFEMRDRLKREIRDKVKVHVTLLGGGFGRKSKPDFAIEAAFLARVHEGTPVRVQWTREDDIQFSYFHAVSNQHLEAALDASGKPTTWLQRSAFPSFFGTLFPGPFPGVPPIFLTARRAFHGGDKYPYGSGIEKAHGLEDMPFSMQNIRIENCPAQNHIRVGWMRSVSNIFHAFSICSFAHELAVKANAPDPKKYLLDLIGEGGILDLEAEGVTAFDNNGFPAFRPEGNPAIIARYPPDTRRLRGVIDKVAEISKWDEKYGKLGPRRGLGIAAHRSFLSYVAIVCDVSLSENNELKINDVFGVIDCGRAVNVDRVLAQMEGGIVYGLSYALLGEITVKNGAVVQNNFDNYPVLRLHQTPKITVDYIKSSADPTGVGEPPTPAVAPALANAIVAAGGPRIREIPFYRKVVVH